RVISVFAVILIHGSNCPQLHDQRLTSFRALFGGVRWSTPETTDRQWEAAEDWSRGGFGVPRSRWFWSPALGVRWLGAAVRGTRAARSQDLLACRRPVQLFAGRRARRRVPGAAT